MDKINRKLQKLLYAFIMLVIIVAAAFAATIYHSETKYISKTEEKEEVSPMEVMVTADESSGSAPLEVSLKARLWNQIGDVNYSWDFGDGETSSEPNPTHIYAEVGEYNCTLTVIDREGRKLSENITIKVLQNRPPKVEINVSPTVGRRPMEVHFDAEAYDEDGKIVSYEWVIIHPPMFLGSYYPRTVVSEENFTKTFWRKGDYDVSLTVKDDSGNFVKKDIRLKCQDSLIEVIVTAPIDMYQTAGWYYDQVKTQVEFAISNGIWEKLYDKFDQLGMDDIVKSMDKILNFLKIEWYPGIEVNNPPYVPNVLSPADNATGIDVNANVSWNCSDPDGDPIMYDVYFGKISPPPLASDDQNATTFDPGTLESNTEYYWRIVALDGRGGSTSSPIWRFKTA